MNRVAQHPVQAFAAALGAVAVLSVMDAVMKALVIAIGIYAVSIWRALANLIVASAMYLPHRLPWPTRATLRIHIWRAVVITVMAFLFFWGIGRVPLAQAISLTFIAPLIALLLASVFLHEKIGSRSIAGSFIAFGGVILIVAGQATANAGPGVLLGTAAIIGSALCYAVNIVLMRKQAVAAKPLEINFFQGLTVAVIWGAPDRYAWVRDAGPGAVLELPAGELDTALRTFQYEYQSLFHQHPIVNGASGSKLDVRRIVPPSGRIPETVRWSRSM